MWGLADLMPARNADLGDRFSTDDLLCKIMSKTMVGDSIGQNMGKDMTKTVTLQAPLNSRMASKNTLEMDKVMITMTVMMLRLFVILECIF